MLPALAAAQADAGRALFEARCARCHAGPASLKTEAARVAAVFRRGTVRQHRAALSDAEWKALTDYLQTAGAHP